MDGWCRLRGVGVGDESSVGDLGQTPLRHRSASIGVFPSASLRR
jgi:hypothetical protein